MAPRRSSTAGLTPRAITSYGLLTTFIGTFLLLGVLNRTSFADGFKKKRPPSYPFPDFDKVRLERVLGEDELNIVHPQDRVIFIGDVHGMNESLHHLLDKVSYNPQHDTLLFAGDLLAKSSHQTSLSVIDFLTKNHIVSINGTPKERIFPVRGNHDHMVVQWRNWRQWFGELRLSAPATPASSLLSLSFLDSLSEPFGTLYFFGGESPAEVPPVNTGKEFLALIEAEWKLEQRHEKGADPEEYVEVARKRARGTWREAWWHRIPQPGKGRTKQMWKMFGDHYWLARDMTQEQAEYLISLPLVNHIPHFHTFIAHAGLLPSDPRLAPTDLRQPLSHRPSTDKEPSLPYNPDEDHEDRLLRSRLAFHLAQHEVQYTLASESYAPDSDTFAAKSETLNEEALRRLQQEALLDKVPQNQDPWVILNMRSVKRNGKVTRNGDKGTPWSDIWNDQMSRCDGYDDDVLGLLASDAEQAKKGKYTLACRPSTVVYGHAASRGLDVKRWSMGLDTGCLYGGELTAMIITRQHGRHVEDVDVEQDATKKRKKLPVVRFGDRKAGFQANLVQVTCPTMD